VREEEQQKTETASDAAGIDPKPGDVPPTASESDKIYSDTDEIIGLSPGDEDLETEELPDEPPSNAGAEPKQPINSTQASEAVFQRNFKPISPAKLKKARRTRRTLITVIVLLLIVLIGGVAGGVYYYLNFVQSETTHAYDPIVMGNEGDTLDDRGVTEALEMPDLALMFGMTPEAVLAMLGEDYSITKIDSDTQGQTSDTETEANAATKQIVTISYTPQDQSNASSLRQTQKIYLSLGEQGTTIEIYFVSSMDILDFPISSFADLVATNDLFVRTLTLAGVVVSPDAVYLPPSSKEFTEFVDPDANALRIKKETTTWSGRLLSGAAPTAFEITFTYDYGASGVDDAPDKHPLQRMVYLKLS